MKKIYKYLITLGIGLLAVCLIIFLQGITSKDNAKDVMKVLTDAFFAVGVVIAGFGLLVIASNGGTFDMLYYGILRLFYLFKRNMNDVKYKSFYEFRVSREERPKPFLYLLLVGLFILSISFIFLILYYNV